MAAISLTDITIAITNSSICLKVPSLKNGVPQKYNGRIVSYSGNYGAVFRYDFPDGTSKAVRVWTKDLELLPKLPLRSKTISEELKKYASSYFSKFEFFDKGILVRGNLYPIVVMDWEKGLNLKDYISANLTQSDKLRKLANSFLEMVKWFHANHISHGDLQHGNILIDDHSNIKLIDYDSIYLPNVGFDLEQEEIKGLPDYQHPNRGDNYYMSEKVDYFSELVIYTSLIALANRPELWTEYNVYNRDFSLLFDVHDFSNFRQSNIYSALKKLGPNLEVLLSIFELYLSESDINMLESFDKVLDRMTKTPIINYFEAESENVYVGDKVMLVWDIGDAISIYLDDDKVLGSKCEKEIKTSGKNYFALKVTNGFKTISEKVCVNAFDRPQIDIRADNNILKRGCSEETCIHWNITNAKEAFLEYDSFSLNVPLSGETIVNPNATTVYRIRVTGEDGVRSFIEQLTIGVCDESIVEFSTNRNEVLPKLPVELSWKVQNAQNVELVGYGTVDFCSNKVVNPDKDINYILRVEDAFGITDYSCSIKILPEPIIEFKASKLKINKDKNEGTTITWKVANSTNVILENDEGLENVASVGSLHLSPQKTMVFTLHVIGVDGYTEYTKQLRIKVFAQAQIRFSSDKLYTLPGVPVILSWHVENAKKVELKGFGKVEKDGNKSINVTENTRYTLIVTDEFSTQEKELEIKMLPLPTVKEIKVPVPEINKPLRLVVNVPIFEPKIAFPTISLLEANINFPKFNSSSLSELTDVSSFKMNLGLFIKIKSLFSHYYNKIVNEKK